MTAQIINFLERRQQIRIRRDPFHMPMTFWSLFATYMFIGAIGYCVIVDLINTEIK